MGKFIIKLRDRYYEWSTIVDAPTTNGMSLNQFREFYRWEYGEAGLAGGLAGLDERLARVEQKGSSAFGNKSVSDLICGNRAGENEETLTADEIYEMYCDEDATQ